MDELLTVAEVAIKLRTNKNYVGDLLNSGLLPYLELGRRKVRVISLNNFLEKWEGWDLTDPYHPKKLNSKEEEQ